MKLITVLSILLLPMLTQSRLRSTTDSRLRSTTQDRLRSTTDSQLRSTTYQDTTTLYGYKHPKTNVYYFQDRDIPYGDSMVNDAFKKYKLLVVLEQGVWSNIPLEDKPRMKNGCELYQVTIFQDKNGELILEESKVE